MKNMEIYVNVHAKHLIVELGRLIQESTLPSSICSRERLATSPRPRKRVGRAFARLRWRTNLPDKTLRTQDVPVKDGSPLPNASGFLNKV